MDADQSINLEVLTEQSSASVLPLDQVIEGNCIQALERIPDESVDLVFADPPYNLQLQQELWRPNLTRVDAVDDDWDQFASFAEYDEFTRAWLAACRRVLKRNGTLWVIGTYHNIYRVGTILQDLGYWILNSVTWVKTNPMPNFRGVRFTNATETLLWVQKERGLPYTFNYQAMKALNDDVQMRSDWPLPICTGKQRLKLNGQKAHSTQKPEALLYRILLATTNPGDVVLDPFFGTGTTGAVAHRLRRHWIGIERDPAYVEVARARLAALPATEGEDALYTTPNPRRAPRLPFGALLEHGLLHPGDALYLGAAGAQPARVLADGRIEYNGTCGSIHQVARLVAPDGPAATNGWQAWFYVDPASGERFPLDKLREQLRVIYQFQTIRGTEE